jgi:xanthine dehydrogenase YagT iron-sulfur-binding subunit
MGQKPGISRRSFLGTSATGTALLAVNPHGLAAAQVSAKLTAAVDVALNVNGSDHRLTVDPRMTLLDALRERLALTGSKKGCDHGQCGACTVLVDGRRILSCLTLAADVRGAIKTIEGVASVDGTLHPMQQAFLDNDALQCGYCTPGQIMSGIACVHEGHASTDQDVREYMSGNICRCAAYPHIVSAVRQAKRQMEQS